MTIWRFFGYIIWSLGSLIMLLTGGCAVIMSFTNVADGGLAILVAAIPFCIGWAMFEFGRRMARKETDAIPYAVDDASEFADKKEPDSFHNKSGPEF